MIINNVVSNSVRQGGNDMKKKHLAMRLCAIFCIIVGFSITSFADLDKEKEKKEEMEAQLKDTEKFLDSLKSLKTDSEAYIAAIDQQLNRLATNIYDLQQQAMAKQAEIDTKNTEISAKEEEISNQYDDMALRIQYMYENGDAEYASWLLESSTMTDFLNKAEYISQITQYDRDMLVVLQQCKEELATQKAELEVQLSDLSALIAETEAEQYAQETLITAKKNDLNIYDSQIYGTNAEIAEIQAEIAAQEAIIKELEELERKRKEKGLQLTYDGGSMMWPVPNRSRISSYFGYRSNPFTGTGSEFHSGIDIPGPAGTTIYAAYDGRVDWSYHHFSAGNWIGIDHGNGISTVYMHLSAFLVSEGDYVSKGDAIGLMGSTGRSTGPHLHFSVRVDGSSVDPLSYVIQP